MTSGSIIAGLVSAIVGAAAGALIGYRTGVKKGRESMEKELNEVTDHWRDRMDKLQKKIDKLEGKTPIEKKSRDEKSELYSEDEPSTDTKISYTEYLNKEQDKRNTEKYYNMYNADKSEKFPKDPLIDEPVEDKPELEEYLEIIDEQLYSETALSYSKYTYTWNPEHKVLLDEYQDKAPDELYSKKVGSSLLKSYLNKWVKNLEDTLDTEDRVLYLRDDEHEADYEILLN